MANHSRRNRILTKDVSLFRQLTVLWRDPVASFPLRLILLLTFLLIAIISIFFWRLPPEIPLIYSKPWGTEQLVPSFFLFILFLIVLLLEVINIILSTFLMSITVLLPRMLVWTTALIIFLVDITVLQIVLLVT